MAPRISIPDLPTETDAETKISSHELRCFVAGELSESRRKVIEAQIAYSDAMRERVRALQQEDKADDAVLRLELPLLSFLDHHAQHQRGLPARILSSVFSVNSLRTRVMFGAVVAAAAIFFVVRAPSDGEDVSGPAWDGLKGGDRIAFFVKEGTGAHRGHAGEQLPAGARIQFAVHDAPRAIMILVGIDSLGTVTTYAAEPTTDSTDNARPKGDGARVLPVSVVLDDAVGPERFFVVYADGDVASVKKTVEDAARALATDRKDLATSETLPVPKEFVQSSVHIVKVR